MSLWKARHLCFLAILLSGASAFHIQGAPAKALGGLNQFLRRPTAAPNQALRQVENKKQRSKMLGSVGGMGGAVPSKGLMTTKDKAELLVYIFLWYATSVSSWVNDPLCRSITSSGADLCLATACIFHLTLP